jgi:hypothetical protein
VQEKRWVSAWWKRGRAESRRALPLLPRMKQSPYRFFKCPSTYSSVCSIAMFMNPSRQARTPLYVTPELSFTITGLPITCFRKSVGFFFAAEATESAEAAFASNSIPGYVLRRAGKCTGLDEGNASDVQSISDRLTHRLKHSAEQSDSISGERAIVAENGTFDAAALGKGNKPISYAAQIRSASNSSNEVCPLLFLVTKKRRGHSLLPPASPAIASSATCQKHRPSPV